MEFDSAFLDILACPKCNQRLELVQQPQGFACQVCNLIYAIEDNIPNFLIEEAATWKDEG